MPKPIKTLIVEDCPNDVQLALRNLRNAGFEVAYQVVDNEQDFLAALNAPLDVILSDFSMPNFSGMRALELLQENGNSTPFIIISGSIGEDVAVECMKKGATDYLLKDRLGRLGAAIEQAMEQHRLLREREQAIEALRHSEERFREVVETINEVFWVSDAAKQRLLYVSPAYATIWGRPTEDVLEHPEVWLESIHAEDRARLAQATGSLQTNGYNELYRISRPDGSTRWVREQAFPIRDKQGRVTRVAGATEDVTERRILENKFLQAQKMEAIGTLAGGIAHDFNNILTAINGYTDLIQLQLKGQPELLGHIKSLKQAGLRATSLVRQILNVSRQTEHHREPIQLAEVVTETIALLRASTPSWISFELKVVEEMPAILADSSQMHQILMNLGTNAAQALGHTPGKITVTLELVDVPISVAASSIRLHPGFHVRLSVSDTGPGIPKEIESRIFDPFFTTKPTGIGTGLGLAVVHNIVEAHNAEISVTSSPNEGTTFQIHFPIYQGSSSQAAVAPSPQLQSGNGERIMVVDDEGLIIQVAQLTLERLNYRVDAGTDVLEMLKRLESQPQAYDLVITDLTMPAMTGLEFASRVKALRPDLPIILTTGNSGSLTQASVRQRGLAEMLLKPFTAVTLSQAVQRVLSAQKVPS